MNFLKRLELQGFKSFASKTVLEFPSRVTAIVGPNGSGKSNIIDGLRWVLGERGVKELRGSTLENLIFVGTSKRPALGLAKVTLCFNNHKKQLPFENHELALIRKIDRSGNSQFFLNDSEIKLKDLIPVLARAKLGSRGLTMIGQGQSDLFIKSGARERRMMIEEILGLREFRLKKEQAERRLVLSRINMDKIRAMLEELTPHLRFLKKQKNRFDKRTEIENSLKDFESKYFASHYREIESGLKNLEEPAALLLKKLKEKEEEIRILERGLKEIGEQASDAEKAKELRGKISSLLDRRLAMDKEIAKIEVKKELGAKDASPLFSSGELVNFLQELALELKTALGFESLEKLKNKLRDWLKLLDKFIKKEESASPELSNEDQRLKKELAEINREINNFRNEEERTVLAQYKINREFREKVEILETRKNEIRNLSEKRQILFFEKEKLGLKFEEMERRWLASGYALHELKAVAADKNLVIEAGIDWTDVEKKIMKLRAELAAIGEIDQGLVKEAEESEERYKFLSRELGDLEKATVDLKNLIKELEERIHNDFKNAFRSINDEFNKYFRLMFGGGRAKLSIKKQEVRIKNKDDEESNENNVSQSTEEPEEDKLAGVEIELNLPGKKLSDLEMLSGGEKSLVSLAALFALVSVSPPPFLVLDEIDAALDDDNARRFAELIKEFSKQTQFIIVTHNRATMEAADVLYGVTLGDDGVSKVLSLKLE